MPGSAGQELPGRRRNLRDYMKSGPTGGRNAQLALVGWTWNVEPLRVAGPESAIRLLSNVGIPPLPPGVRNRLKTQEMSLGQRAGVRNALKRMDMG